MGEETTVPLRRQYLQIKAKYPDFLLAFRLGDFYEFLDRDAEIVAEALDLLLTGRNADKGLRVPMCGIPAAKFAEYCERLVAAGHKVAQCDQTGVR